MAEGILACSACLRRAMQLVPHQKGVLERRIVQQALNAGPAIAPRRFVSTASTITTKIAGAPQTPQVDDVEESSEAQKKARLKMERAANKELQYADDPWKIEKLVHNALSKNRYEEALLITQTASKRHAVVVSWNHLINYKLEKQELKAAVKLYNDVGSSTLDSY